MIFEPLKSLDDYLANLEATRRSYRQQAQEATSQKEKKRLNLMAKVLIDEKGARAYYAEIRADFTAPDMITIDEAAARLNITPSEYRALAEAGEALLFSIQPDLERVPAWSITADGKIDALMLDLAREYATNPVTMHSLPDQGFLNFLRRETVIINKDGKSPAAKEVLDSLGLTEVFNAAGPDASLAIEISLPIWILARERENHPEFEDMLIEAFHSKLLGTGWDYGEGLSVAFLTRYGYKRERPDSGVIYKVPPQGPSPEPS